MNAPAPASVEDALRAELADAKAHIAELLERDAVLARDLDELAEHLDGQPMLHAARRVIREMAKALRPLGQGAPCPHCGTRVAAMKPTGISLRCPTCGATLREAAR